MATRRVSSLIASAINRADEAVLPHDIFIEKEANDLCQAISSFAEGVRCREIADLADIPIPPRERTYEAVAAVDALLEKDYLPRGVAVVHRDPWWRLIASSGVIRRLAKRGLKMKPDELARWIAEELEPPNRQDFKQIADTLKRSRDAGSKGGKLKVRLQRGDVAKLRSDVSEAARRLCSPGVSTEHHEVVGILARKFDRTPSTIRRILKQTGTYDELGLGSKKARI